MTKKYNAFLGGECGDNDWRKRVVPRLEAAGVTAFDPVVDGWSKEFEREVERPAKDGADTLIFAFYGETRAVVSMIEVGFAIASGRDIVLLDGAKMSDGCEIRGENITGRQLDDLNRGRYYLAELVADISKTNPKVKIVTTEEELVEYLIAKYGQG